MRSARERSSWVRGARPAWLAAVMLLAVSGTARAHVEIELDPFREAQGRKVTELERVWVAIYGSSHVDVREIKRQTLRLGSRDREGAVANKRKKKDVRPAVELLRENRKTLVDKVTYWTGVQRPLVKKLVESIEDRVAALDLRTAIGEQRVNLAEVSVYATALAMNYLARGKFVSDVTTEGGG